MSSIQIKIIAVTNNHVKTDRGGYDVCEVTYKNLTFQDKVEAKKLMSFSHKDVFNAFKTMQPESVVTVQRMKNDKGFWDWVSIGEDGAEPASEGRSSTGGTTVNKATATPKSTYETPDERAAKQVYIIRQSSIANAVETLKVDKKAIAVEDVLDVAQQYFEYVMGNNAKTAQVAKAVPELDDDIPY